MSAQNRLRAFMKSGAVLASDLADLAPIPRGPNEVSGVGAPPPPDPDDSSGEQDLVAGVPQTPSHALAVVGAGADQPADGKTDNGEPQSVLDAFEQIAEFNWPGMTRPQKKFIALAATSIWATMPAKGRIPVTLYPDKQQQAEATEQKVAQMAKRISAWFEGQWFDEKIRALAPKIALFPFASVPWDEFQKHNMFRTPALWREINQQLLWVRDLDHTSPGYQKLLDGMGKPVNWSVADMNEAPFKIIDEIYNDKDKSTNIPWEDVPWDAIPWASIQWDRLPIIDPRGAAQQISRQLNEMVNPAPDAAKPASAPAAAASSSTIPATTPATQAASIHPSVQSQSQLPLQNQAEIVQLRASVVQLQQALADATQPAPPAPAAGMGLLGWIAVVGVAGAIFYATVNMDKLTGKSRAK